jgi:uncharacterized protein YegP (UPF0339 family)
MKAVRHLVLTLALAGAIGTAGTHFAAAQAKKDKDTKGVATFEVFKSKDDKYRFRYKDGEGVTQAISVRGYETKADCHKVVESIRTAAAKAKVVDAQPTTTKK